MRIRIVLESKQHLPSDFSMTREQIIAQAGREACDDMFELADFQFIEDVPAEETGSRQAHPPTAPSRSLPSIGEAPNAA